MAPFSIQNISYIIFLSFSLHYKPCPRNYYSTGLKTQLTHCIRLHCLLIKVPPHAWKISTKSWKRRAILGLQRSTWKNPACIWQALSKCFLNSGRLDQIYFTATHTLLQNKTNKSPSCTQMDTSICIPLSLIYPCLLHHILSLNEGLMFIFLL